MAEPVSVDDLKVHLRLGSGTGEDSYLAGLVLAARRKIEIETRRSFSGAEPTLSGDDAALAAHAILITAGHWYDHRDASNTLPDAVGWIVDDLRKWDDGAEE